MKTAEQKKTINLKLVGLDGNPFSLMGAFSRQARREGWNEEEIDAVLNECTSGDYNHLLATLSGVCVPNSELEDEDED